MPLAIVDGKRNTVTDNAVFADLSDSKAFSGKKLYRMPPKYLPMHKLVIYC